MRGTAYILIGLSLGWAAVGVPGVPRAAGADVPLSPEPTPERIEQVRRSHWSFQAVARSALPAVKDEAWVKSPVDAFVLARLEAVGIKPSPRADRRTLIRRASFDLIGLPPTYEEVEAFVRDDSVEAWPKLIERLLASPHYGERWARHWLDVARYADTKGYVGVDGAANRYPFAYTYRDYVIRAFNEDKPFDRFIIEQLAADKLDLGEDNSALAAMGLLTVGRRMGKVETIDDRIDTVTRGFMALTVSCARCHDHKYDPIPTEDFYALYGIFDSCTEPDDLPVIGKPAESPEFLAFKEELAKREQAIADFLEGLRVKVNAELRERVSDYLVYIAKTHPKHQTGKEPASGKRGFLRPGGTREWQAYLAQQNGKWHPVWGVMHLLSEIEREGFAENAKKLIDRLDEIEKEKGPINAKVKQALREKPPATFADAAETIGTLLEETHKQWEEASKPEEGKSTVAALADAAAEELRQELYADGSPTSLTVERAQRLIGQGERGELNKLEAKVTELRGSHPGAPPAAMVMLDEANPRDSHVFLRGNPGSRGDIVPRRFPAVLANVTDDARFTNGSGRLELARAIASPKNPLTPRVIVNRLWHHHFAAGIVRTTSDFGVRSDEPSHPELLDFLAAELIEQGWSLKHVHRLIMLSATYQQASTPRTDASAVDPENRLLGRMNIQRLEFEPMRDALLSAAGRLDASMYGRPVELFGKEASTRRAVYGFIDRQDLPGTLANFDFANPDASQPHRSATTVPQQALYLMNSAFMIEQVRQLVQRPEVADAADRAAKIKAVYRLALSRDPTAEELEFAAAFVGEDVTDESKDKHGAMQKLAQALMLSNEFVFVE